MNMKFDITIPSSVVYALLVIWILAGVTFLIVVSLLAKRRRDRNLRNLANMRRQPARTFKLAPSYVKPPNHPQGEVLIHGMESECLACGERWDTNDPHPPSCKMIDLRVGQPKPVRTDS